MKNFISFTVVICISILLPQATGIFIYPPFRPVCRCFCPTPQITDTTTPVEPARKVCHCPMCPAPTCHCRPCTIRPFIGRAQTPLATAIAPPPVKRPIRCHCPVCPSTPHPTEPNKCLCACPKVTRCYCPACVSPILY